MPSSFRKKICDLNKKTASKFKSIQKSQSDILKKLLLNKNENDIVELSKKISKIN